MADISREDRRRYAETHASAEPARKGTSAAGDAISNVSNSSNEPVILLEDHFASGLAGGFDELPHVVPALEELQANPAKLDKLSELLSAEITRRYKARREAKARSK